jgi:hypothetical protein
VGGVGFSGGTGAVEALAAGLDVSGTELEELGATPEEVEVEVLPEEVEVEVLPEEVEVEVLLAVAKHWAECVLT